LVELLDCTVRTAVPHSDWRQLHMSLQAAFCPFKLTHKLTVAAENDLLFRCCLGLCESC